MTNDQWMNGSEIPCHLCGTQGRPLHQRNAEGWACAPCYRDRITELEEFARWARDTPTAHDLHFNPWAVATHRYAVHLIGRSS